jgi:hypothetical protein
LWSRGRLSGIVDRTSASWGPAAVDTAHMRWNLAFTYGLDAADEFLRRYRSLAVVRGDDQHYSDLVTVLDLIPEIDPDDWSALDLARLEPYIESVLPLLRELLTAVARRPQLVVASDGRRLSRPTR